MSMTLEQVRDWHRNEAERLRKLQHPFPNNSTVLQSLIAWHDEAVKVLESHLTTEDNHE